MLYHGVPASLANSSGIFLGDMAHFDLVRPGAALYGINPTPGRANPMRNVLTLSGRILQVRKVAARRDRRLWRHLERQARRRASRWPRSAMPTD